MPGIFGVIGWKNQVAGGTMLPAMAEACRVDAKQRSGIVSSSEWGIHAGWAAPSGSFAARHSGSDEVSGIALAFSGECYRDDCESVSTASWIIREYEKKGDRCFEDLNGLFSGLLIDRRRARAFLFNDRYGIERIYVHERGGAVYFASEAKALLSVFPELRSFDDEGLAQYLAFGCTMGDRTLFRGIDLLPGASRWRFGPQGLESKSRYFTPSQWETQEPLTEQQYEAELGETFQRILPRYTEHGESVGISLTGGLDTRMVMACLPDSDTPHPCYTFVGESGLTLDSRIAARVAADRGLEHRPLRIHSDFLRDFGSHLDQTVYVTDGCAGATASHEIYFNAQARQLSPIRLTGNFGSEILRSVSTFKPLRLDPSLLGDGQAKDVAAAAEENPGEGAHPVTFAAFREIPWSLFGLLAAGRSQVTFRTPYLDNELVALAYRAPAAQRLFSLPALRLIEKARPELARIPTDRGELLGSSALAHAARRAFGEITFKLDYLHKEGLPGSLGAFDPFLNLLAPFGVLGLHKFLPYRRWFQNELAPTIMERISSEHVRKAPWWAPGAPEALARDHCGGRGNHVRELNAVLTLEAIDRLFFRSQGRQEGRPIRPIEVASEACRR